MALATPHAAAGGVGSQLADPLSDFADVVNLLRGVHAVLGVTWEWVRKGPIKPLLATRDYNASAARQLPEDALPAFQLLRAKIAKAWPLDETEPAEDLSPNPRNNGQDDGNLGKDYHFACRRLEIALMDVRERPGDRIALAWPVVISKTFVKEFKEGKALALVLLAFYGAILHDLKDSWWMGSWGRQIVKRVAKDLEGGEWDEVLLWPLQIVGEGE